MDAGHAVLIFFWFVSLVLYSMQKTENEKMKRQLDSYVEDRGELIKKLDEYAAENLKLNRMLNG